MTTTSGASYLSLNKVKALLNYQQWLNDSFASLLTLETLTEFEQQELEEIRTYAHSYYAARKTSEGLSKLLILAPLLRLAGFYTSSITIHLEEKIADILEEDKGTPIKGRMDILTLNQETEEEVTQFCVLVLETNNRLLDSMEGLPRLLTYAYKILENRPFVWGLTTNGLGYQFVYIEQGNPPVYQLLPDLSLFRPDSSIQVLQVLKAVCKQYFHTTV